jgi:hypothetical protein
VRAHHEQNKSDDGMRVGPWALTLAIALVGCLPALDDECGDDADCPDGTCVRGVCVPDEAGSDGGTTDGGAGGGGGGGDDAAATTDAATGADTGATPDATSTPDAAAPADAAADATIQPGDGGPTGDACVAGDEICNGQDDDCDGISDEGFDGLGAPCELLGICAGSGFVVCAEDGLGTRCIGAVEGRPEACNDQDDDCDGATDEDAGQACYFGPAGTEGIGECRAGAYPCAVEGDEDATCMGEVQPTGEVCDGLDNDCDGAIDNGIEDVCYEGDVATLSAPATACRFGTRRCDGGEFGPCEGQVLPAESDICDGLNNDCDESVDEDCVCEPGAPCEGEPVGACRPGVQVCEGPILVGCEGRVEPTDEICNGVDDDCDGAIDEMSSAPCYDGPEGTAGVGTCVAGVQRCEGGQLLPCAGAVGPVDAEVCDARDDDCDGAIDEDFPDVGQPCEAGVGACRSNGFTLCAEGGAICGATPGEAGVEACNAIDDDCDGRTDEETAQACYSGPAATRGVGRCEDGMRACVEGQPGECAGEVGPGEEVCDGDADEDCDGNVDEGCVCRAGEERRCGTDVGVCRFGTQQCGAAGWGACGGAVNPVFELCDGDDNDCDGNVDESIGGLGGCYEGDDTTRGVGVCRAGTSRCVDGAVTCAGSILPTEEICDGKDNDCDGQTDESFPGQGDDCGTGQPGACGPGTLQCIGNDPYCVPTTTPAAEACDDVDNDCDGAVDEGLTRVCGSDEGACQRGREACAAGAWGACQGGTDATEERCNGVDDDCDGSTDEGLVRDCGTDVGECQLGTETCVAGEWGACDGAVWPAPFDDCEGRTADEDCDGQAEEDCDCVGSATRPCGSEEGVCQPGTQTCRAGQWSDDCVGATGPFMEACDDAFDDEDCDGVVDEGCDGDGDGFTAAEGDCDDDDPLRNPGKEEVCDGVDQDCDDVTDEDIGGASCVVDAALGVDDVGLCAAGVAACVDGVLECVALYPDGPPNDIDQCDGFDDDCDGRVDETPLVSTGPESVTAGEDDSADPEAVWIGERGWQVIWMRESANEEGRPVDILEWARVDVDGDVVDGPAFPFGADATGSLPQIALAGDVFVVTTIRGQGIYAAFHDGDNPLTPMTAMGGSPSYVDPADVVATGADRALMVWTSRVAALNRDIKARPVRLVDGAIPNDQVSSVSVAGGNDDQPAIAWGGETAGIVWIRSTGLWFARVRWTGALVGNRVELWPNNSASPDRPDIAWSGTEFGITWVDTRSTGQRRVMFGRVNAAGATVGILQDVSASGITVESPPRISWDGENDQYFVSWVQRVDNGPRQIMGRRISEAGAPLGDPVQIHQGADLFRNLTVAAVASTGQPGVFYDSTADGRHIEMLYGDLVCAP